MTARIRLFDNPGTKKRSCRHAQYDQGPCSNSCEVVFLEQTIHSTLFYAGEVVRSSVRNVHRAFSLVSKAD